MITGPTLPAKVAKHLDTNILLASAHLSDLKSQGKIKISSLKIGGSPLYFLPGHEEKLYDFAAGNMNVKDLDVLNRLKERQVLREEELDLLAKVALRSLKDFAVPLNVNAQGSTELFWKWHLLPQEETNAVIGEILRGEAPQKEEVAHEEETAQREEVTAVEEPAAKEVVPETRIPDKEPEQEIHPEPQPGPAEPDIKLPKETEAQPSLEPEVRSTGELRQEVEKKEEQRTLAEETPKKKPLLAKLKEKITRKKSPVPDTFLPKIEEFFNELTIDIEEQDIIRKNSEMNFIIKVPSVVGKINYFCKTKNKKRCDEKDLSTAYMEAQMKKLPLLFLYTDDLTKRAKEMFDSGAFENAVLKKVE